MTTPRPARPLTGIIRRQPENHPHAARTTSRGLPAQARALRHRRTASRGAVPDSNRGER
ncbi:hypothetical protein [Kitasatospora purpeofusca]|uniref:hypothetical protein n=1 Tax=Kitasatospora purpeofusca TaxID=67352 RepID=UPI0036D3BA92